MSEPRNRSPVPVGTLVGGKYKVERVLGSGGMGVVVAARHVDLDQEVALKFILPEAVSGKGNVERFMREARAAVRLKSEHVARVYDVGRDEDRPFMVLELLEGMDLAKLHRHKGPFAVADAVEYVLQACEGLLEAHGMGIVHRDLKPQNLFLTRRPNGAPLVKVLDFGISKTVGPAAEGQLALTDSAAIIGSPLYMAPEQMRSARTADVRTDVWAMGVILYELLGGQLPFDGETVTAVCIRVVNEEPTSLLTLRPSLDPRLVGVVMKCLEKEPDGRWQNIAQLAGALEPYAKSSQVGAVRPWRSFEETGDGTAAAPPSEPSWADATGPATAITMPSSPHDPDARKPSLVTTSDPPAPLVATDVTWGKATTAPKSARAPIRRGSFRTGVIFGGVAALGAAAAAFLIVLGRSAGEAPIVSSSGSTAFPATSNLPAAPVPAPVAAAVVDAGTLESRPVPPPVAPQARRVVRAPSSVEPPPPAPPASTTPPPPRGPAPIETNGAPILR